VHSSVIHRRAIIHGHVQGVFFREETRRRASALAVAGWVRNVPDGTVEAAFEGEPDAVEAMLEFCAEGPPLARVDRVDVEDEEAQGLSGFEVR
jgi:acylphosphatase